MRFFFPLLIAGLCLRLVLGLTAGGQEVGIGIGILVAVLIGLAAIDWLFTRRLDIVSPLRVYLLLAAGALIIGYAIYLFSYLGPASALLIAAGLVLTVLVLNRV